MSKRSRPSIAATTMVAPSARMTLKDRQTKASIDQPRGHLAEGESKAYQRHLLTDAAGTFEDGMSGLPILRDDGDIAVRRVHHIQQLCWQVASPTSRSSSGTDA